MDPITKALNDILENNQTTPYNIEFDESRLYNTGTTTGRSTLGGLVGPTRPEEGSGYQIINDTPSDWISSLGSGLSSLWGQSAHLGPDGKTMVGATGIGGFSGLLDGVNAGIGVFNAYDQYKTNKVNRNLANQQLTSNQYTMDKIKRSDEGLAAAFGRTA